MKIILFFLLLLNSYENCDYYHYYDSENNAICTKNNICPDEFSKLIPDTNECVNNCKKDLTYRYEFNNTCYENCPPETELINDEYCSVICTEERPYENLITHECVKNCPLGDLFQNKCKLKYSVNPDENNDENNKDIPIDLIEKIKKDLSSINISDFNPENDDIEDIDKIIIITNTSNNQGQNNNDEFIMKCEILLKNYYGIANEEKIYFFTKTELEYIEYEAYYKMDGVNIIKLNMSICNNIIQIIDNDDYYYDEACTIDKPFAHILEEKCVEKCEMEDIEDDLCYINYYIDEENDEIDSDKYYTFQNTMLEYIETIITSETFYKTSLEDLDYEDNFMETENMKIIFMNPDSLMNNKNSMKTSIDLGECENQLKKIYNLDKIYVKIIELYDNGKKSITTDYEIYGSVDNNCLMKLDKSYCKDYKIDIFIPDLITENDDNVKLNSYYYDDICNRENSDNKINVKVIENENLFVSNNDNLCEKGCVFVEFDKETKRVKCSCGENNKIYDNFVKTKDKFNFGVLSCKVFSSKDNIKSNMGFYILTIIIGIFIIILILFCSQGFVWFINKTDEIINTKFNITYNNNPIPIIQNNQINQINPIIPMNQINQMYPINQFNQVNNNNNNNLLKKEKNVRNTTKKSTKKKPKNQKPGPRSNNFSQNAMMSNNINSNMVNLPINNTSVFEQNMAINIQPAMQTVIPKQTDYELNWLSYNDALKYDRRKMGEYYCSLIKSKQLFVLSFCNMNDYNSNIIKKYFIFLSFAVHYTINGFLFSDSSMNKIYSQEEGNNIIAYQLPHIIYSAIFSIFLVRIFVRNFALNDKDAIEVKRQMSKDFAINMQKNRLRCIKIKFAIFFVINFLFLGFSFYFLTSFNAVYKSSQTLLLETTIISFAFTLCLPFVINIIPAMFRSCSLQSQSSGITYKLSQIFQYL